MSKFGEGAWIVVLLIPLIRAGLSDDARHYQEVARELTLRGLPPSLKPLAAPRVVLPISGVHRGVLEALRYAQSISDNVTAVYVEINPAATEKVRAEWETWVPDVPLERGAIALSIHAWPVAGIPGADRSRAQRRTICHGGLARIYSRRIAGNTCCTIKRRGC